MAGTSRTRSARWNVDAKPDILPDADKLLDAYRHLRRVEGILRRWSYEGEIVLPDDPAPYYRVSVRCGFATPGGIQESAGKMAPGDPRGLSEGVRIGLMERQCIVIAQILWGSDEALRSSHSGMFPLPRGFVKKHRGGGADVQRIHRRRHGNRHRFVARFQNRRRNAVAFAAEDEAAIAGEIRLRQKSFVRVRMRGDAADAASAQFLQTFQQASGFVACGLVVN